MNFFINELSEKCHERCRARLNHPWGPSKVPVGGPRTAPLWTHTPLVPPWAWKTIVLALGRRYPPAGQKKSCQKGAKPEPATGIAGGDAQGGVGPRGPWAEPALALGNPLTHNQDEKSSLIQPTKKSQGPSC